MDDPAVSREDLALSLRYIRGVNRRLGGVSALLHHLKAWSRDWPAADATGLADRPITLLDIGTGSADLPVAAVLWGRGLGFDLRVTAIDVHPTTLELAGDYIREQERRHPAAGGQRPLSEAITLHRHSALRLMDHFKAGSFDYVHAGLFLHHLPEIEVLTVLRIMDRLSRAGLVWNDLVRSRVGLATINLLTLGMPRIIRHDATVSVRAGFSRAEALDLATRAGITRPAYRWSLLTHRFTVFAGKRGAW